MSLTSKAPPLQAAKKMLANAVPTADPYCFGSSKAASPGGPPSKAPPTTLKPPTTVHEEKFQSKVPPQTALGQRFLKEFGPNLGKKLSKNCF